MASHGLALPAWSDGLHKLPEDLYSRARPGCCRFTVPLSSCTAVRGFPSRGPKGAAGDITVRNVTVRYGAVPLPVPAGVGRFHNARGRILARAYCMATANCK